MNSRVFQLLAVLMVVAICASGAMAAVANGPHSHIALKSGHHSAAVTPNPGPPPNAGLYGISAYFAAESLNQPGNAWTGPYPGLGTSASPNDLWPCFGADTLSGTDCLYIGSTGTSDPASLDAEVVIGDPSYTWYLSANTATTQPYGCDSTGVGPNNIHPCLQIENFYEDNSGDTTDDLLFMVTATQSGGTIYASGTQDYGPNPYGDLDPAGTIVFYEDAVFGIPNGGAENNLGPCFLSYNYPSNVTGGGYATFEGLANTFEGYWGIGGTKIGVAGAVTCVAPAPGAAAVTITTQLAAPTWAKETTAAKCTLAGVYSGATMPLGLNSSSPYCYTVKYKAKYTLTQKFNVWFR